MACPSLTDDRKESTSDTMSSDEYIAAHRSRRQSSNDSLSEHGTSDGAHTAMTSILDTDEEMAEDMMDHGEGDMYEYDTDIQSLYPASLFPPFPNSYRHDMSYGAGGSFMGNSDIAASTRSLWAQDLDYREIHGRLYCREWFMPIDEVEQLRGALNHQVFLHVLGEDQTIAPLENPTNILDVGTGTGEWAIKLAEVYPNCEVVGTDIAAIAETRSVPMNVFFEIEDAENWDRPSDFYDLVHFRSMEGAFKDWRAIYQNVYHSLKPGGWIELQDFDTTKGLSNFTAHFGTDSPIHKLLSDLYVAAERSGRPRGNAHMDARLFMEAGFVDVKVMEYMIPITVAEKSAGKIWLISCLDSLEAISLRLLTEQMGWDAERCKLACETAARELADLAKKPEVSTGLSVNICVVVGRKPLDAAPSSPV